MKLHLKSSKMIGHCSTKIKPFLLGYDWLYSFEYCIITVFVMEHIVNESVFQDSNELCGVGTKYCDVCVHNSRVAGSQNINWHLRYKQVRLHISELLGQYRLIARLHIDARFEEGRAYCFAHVGRLVCPSPMPFATDKSRTPCPRSFKLVR